MMVGQKEHVSSLQGFAPSTEVGGAGSHCGFPIDLRFHLRPCFLNIMLGVTDIFLFTSLSLRAG